MRTHIRFFPSGHIDVGDTGLYDDPVTAAAAFIESVLNDTVPQPTQTYAERPNATTELSVCDVTDSLEDFHARAYGRTNVGNSGIVASAVHDFLYPPPPEE
jgi:hypothetical protein